MNAVGNDTPNNQLLVAVQLDNGIVGTLRDKKTARSLNDQPFNRHLAIYTGNHYIVMLRLYGAVNNEQIAGLIQFWRQVPGEFLVGAVPPAASGIFFCLWLTRNKAQPIRIEQLLPTSHEN